MRAREVRLGPMSGTLPDPGPAPTLDEVLDFYERRFQMGLTPQERADLLAFLRAL